MKKVFLSIVITALVAACGYFGYSYFKNDQNVSGWNAESDTIIGSAANLKTLPGVAVFKKTTTTPATGEGGMNDGGAVVIQDFVTEGFDELKVYTMAKGDTSTSTMFARLMVSFEDNRDNNYFDIATSTENRITATTTLGDMITAVAWDPGLATTTKVLTFNVKGYKYARLVVWSENLSTDPNDGVQAFIKVVKVNNK